MCCPPVASRSPRAGRCVEALAAPAVRHATNGYSPVDLILFHVVLMRIHGQAWRAQGVPMNLLFALCRGAAASEGKNP